MCEFLELGHTSEIGMQVRAPDLKTLFACAGRTIFTLIGGEADPDSPRETQEIRIESFDIESLMVDWLGEVLYLFEAHGMIVDQCVIHHISDNSIHATVTLHRPLTMPVLDVKAVTYHQLEVAPDKDGWQARIFVDI